MLSTNDYPDGFFEPIIKERKHQIYNFTPWIPVNNKKLISVSYVQGFCERIQEVLSNHHIKVAHQSNDVIRNIFPHCIRRVIPTVKKSSIQSKTKRLSLHNLVGPSNTLRREFPHINVTWETTNWMHLLSQNMHCRKAPVLILETLRLLTRIKRLKDLEMLHTVRSTCME